MAKEAAKASRQKFYNLEVEETEIQLAEELIEVCRDYCKETWMEALNLGLVPSVLDPFLSYKNLLDSLHKSDKGIPCKIEKEARMEMAP